MAIEKKKKISERTTKIIARNRSRGDTFRKIFFAGYLGTIAVGSLYAVQACNEPVNMVEGTNK